MQQDLLFWWVFHSIFEKHLSDKEFAEAVVDFDKAISSLPNGDISIAKKLRLEKAKAQMQCSQLPEAYKYIGHNKN